MNVQCGESCFMDVTVGAPGPQGIQGDVGPIGSPGLAGLDLVHADPPQGSSQDRLKDNGNGTVTDGQTGLIWLGNWDCPGFKDWVDAIDWAAGLEGGQCGLTDRSSAGDRRLPLVTKRKDYTRNPQDDSMLEASFSDGSPNVPNTQGQGCWSPGDPFDNVASDATGRRRPSPTTR